MKTYNEKQVKTLIADLLLNERPATAYRLRINTDTYGIEVDCEDGRIFWPSSIPADYVIHSYAWVCKL